MAFQRSRRGVVGAPSLRELAKQQCLRCYRFISDVGDAPYDLVEPILKKMGHEQILRIEEQSPQIEQRSDSVWKHLIQRDFRHRPLPPDGYRETYLQYAKEKEVDLKNASQRLRASMQKFNQEKASNTIIALETDPLAARARAKQKAKTHPGSKLIQRARTNALNNRIFSPKNIKFAPTFGGVSKSPSDKPRPVAVHPPRSSNTPSSVAKQVEAEPHKKPVVKHQPSGSIFMPARRR
ncbi:hypothetical protein TRVA0_053S00166 [Trichomonascus vanleenenianus]|uniref:elongin A n=1 Tax=Trichomonascus vanleenenianus TaxID=2268995 RepID=UPI003EC96707